MLTNIQTYLAALPIVVQIALAGVVVGLLGGGSITLFELAMHKLERGKI